MSEEGTWWPPRPDVIPSSEGVVYEKEESNAPCPLHSVFTSGDVSFVFENVWKRSNGVTKQMKASSRRKHLRGVEVRDLPEQHFLHGQQGLFATKRFYQFDIIGEYCGEVVPANFSGDYVASLEDKTHSESLGLNAEHMGNESRFINSYKNIGHLPNVAMKTAYVHGMPHILILVIAHMIEPGDELLLDYGSAYSFGPPPVPNPPAVALAPLEDRERSLARALPRLGLDGGGDDDSGSDSS